MSSGKAAVLAVGTVALGVVAVLAALVGPTIAPVLGPDTPGDTVEFCRQAAPDARDYQLVKVSADELGRYLKEPGYVVAVRGQCPPPGTARLAPTGTPTAPGARVTPTATTTPRAPLDPRFSEPGVLPTATPDLQATSEALARGRPVVSPDAPPTATPVSVFIPVEQAPGTPAATPPLGTPTPAAAAPGPIPTATAPPASTPTPMATATSTPTRVPPSTSTATPTATGTPTATPTSTSTPTPTETPVVLPPQDVAVHKIEGTSVTLGWRPSPSSGVVRYVVYQATSGAFSTAKLASEPWPTGATVIELQFGITYYFRVIAINGAGQWSPPSNVTSAVLGG